ncbi:flagellar filament capping protein FliD [Billgrantia diversa]|uniref:flagellar filament capping protein FliD n=1 Tax=Halomonas sp. MCCC 1A13316 TaxID=2733487 RepID=UPI0018A4F0F9|nr:flagellar filament capping protein FliD [Halomonas sp. MCCC 1A13316]QOR39206.1 flagellar filament capping protein FliD [Halomonas sp. MCCC 1A13316]
MASISSLGIGSGLDLNGLLDQLRSAERQKLQPIAQQKAQQEAKISAFGRLKAGVDKLQGAAQALNDSTLYQKLSASVQGDGMSASASDAASPGRYDVAVTSIATAGTLATTRVDSLETSLTDAGSTLDLAFGDGTTHTVALEAGSTLEGMRDAINADEAAGVDASIINDGTGYRLVLSSRETGADAGITGMTFTGLSAGVTLGEDAATARTGKDASLTINGIAITSATNTVEEAIQGVTLSLTPEAEGNTLSLTVSRDDGSVKDAVNKWVSAYNELQSTIGRMIKPGVDGTSSGELIGDRTVRTLESRMVQDLTSSVPGGDFSLLSDLGVSLNKEGKLEVDEAALDAAITDSPAAVSAFFAGDSEEAGMAGQFSGTLKQILDDNGMLGNAIEGAESRVESLNERFTRMEASVERTIERYRQQFSQLDTMIAQMNQTSDYLFQQFDMMNAQLGRE